MSKVEKKILSETTSLTSERPVEMPGKLDAEQAAAVLAKMPAKDAQDKMTEAKAAKPKVTTKATTKAKGKGKAKGKAKATPTEKTLPAQLAKLERTLKPKMQEVFAVATTNNDTIAENISILTLAMDKYFYARFEITKRAWDRKDLNSWADDMVGFFVPKGGKAKTSNPSWYNWRMRAADNVIGKYEGNLGFGKTRKPYSIPTSGIFKGKLCAPDNVTHPTRPHPNSAIKKQVKNKHTDVVALTMDEIGKLKAKLNGKGADEKDTGKKEDKIANILKTIKYVRVILTGVQKGAKKSSCCFSAKPEINTKVWEEINDLDEVLTSDVISKILIPIQNAKNLQGK
jgi:hypothetical protein|tara:strand:+ start:23 stop:1048 length:1026 start_codon:yes stop_codon:yes gene_type:complete